MTTSSPTNCPACGRQSMSCDCVILRMNDEARRFRKALDAALDAPKTPDPDLQWSIAGVVFFIALLLAVVAFVFLFVR